MLFKPAVQNLHSGRLERLFATPWSPTRLVEQRGCSLACTSTMWREEMKNCQSKLQPRLQTPVRMVIKHLIGFINELSLKWHARIILIAVAYLRSQRDCPYIQITYVGVCFTVPRNILKMCFMWRHIHGWRPVRESVISGEIMTSHPWHKYTAAMAIFA